MYLLAICMEILILKINLYLNQALMETSAKDNGEVEFWF